MNDVIFVHDPISGEILDISEKCIEMYGYTPQQIRSMDFSEIMADDSNFNLDTALELIHSAANGNEHVFQWKAKNSRGKSFWVEVNLKGAELSSQKLVLAVARDITKRKQREEAVARLNRELLDRNEQLAKKEMEVLEKNRKLERSQRELKEALSELSDRNFELDQLVYKTSHDLTAPLNSVLGLINIAKQENHLEDPTPISKMEDSIVKLKGFIKSMLNYAKASRLDVQPQPIDFSSLIAESIDSLQYLEGFEELLINYSVDDSEPFYSEKFKLEIILSNILSNAVKYRRPQNSGSYLTISAHVSHEGADIIFKDNGIGISPNNRNSIFGMFHRASDQAEGTGLGMYIVKQVVEKLSGKISIESELGTGTMIRVVIPNGNGEKLKQELATSKL